MSIENPSPFMRQSFGSTYSLILVCAVFCIMPMVVLGQPNNTRTSALDLELLDEQSRQIKMVVFIALVPLLVAFVFIIFVFYRRKREAFFKQTEAELKLSKAEVEIRALKAQINPHFIFNCMNSIHHYMHRNDIKKAGDYLIKFSQLIRMVLENSSRDTITLKEDLHALTLYIQLEQMRLEHKFDFSIEVAKDVDLENSEVPALLIQPFVENAIWHELTKIAEQGFLKIDIAKKDDGIWCQVKSEGRGKVAGNFTSALTNGIKKTSMGQALIRERLDLIYRMNGQTAYFSSKDISQPEQDRYGHQVDLFIPLKDS